MYKLLILTNSKLDDSFYSNKLIGFSVVQKDFHKFNLLNDVILILHRRFLQILAAAVLSTLLYHNVIKLLLKLNKFRSHLWPAQKVSLRTQLSFGSQFDACNSRQWVDNKQIC